MLEIGDKMPEFTLQDQDGNIHSSSEYLGKKTVVYFYPKDSTPGCTTEACDIRDNYERFLSLGYNVIGVSKDSVSSHRKFADKYTLPFTLLSDPTTEMLQAFGSWGEKKMCGKVSIGTLRTTFIFDENGVVVDVIKKVDTKNHTAQILK